MHKKLLNKNSIAKIAQKMAILNSNDTQSIENSISWNCKKYTNNSNLTTELLKIANCKFIINDKSSCKKIDLAKYVMNTGTHQPNMKRGGIFQWEWRNF